MWAILGLLLVVAALLVFIALRVDNGVAAIQNTIIETTRAQLQAAVRQTAELEEIARHTKRSAEPFFEADADRLRHPERYDSDL